MHWALWLLSIALTLLVLTQYVAPWLVRRLSSNVRIRNVGLRSVRGLFLKIGRVTYTVDRIALTVHRSPGGTRVGLEFQNVVVTISPGQAPPPRRPRDNWKTLRQHYSAGFSVASIADMIKSRKPLTEKLSFPKWAWREIVSGVRSAARIIAVAMLTLLIRTLPALTQSFDIHFDQIVTVVEELDGAHAVVKGLTFAALIKFTKLEENENEDADDMLDDIKSPIVPRKSVFKVPEKPRWGDSVRRVWDNATSRTTGFASLTVGVDDVVAYPRPASKNRISDYNARPRLGGFAFTSAGTSGFTTVDKTPPSGCCFSIEGPLQLQMSAGFIPKRMVFRKRSGEAMIHLPAVHLAPDVMLSLLKRLKKPEDIMSESSDLSHPLTMSPSWGPVTFSPPGSPVIGPKVTSSVSSYTRRYQLHCVEPAPIAMDPVTAIKESFAPTGTTIAWLRFNLY